MTGPIMSKICIEAEEFEKPLIVIQFLDGMIIPRGVCTALFTAPGSGKTTSEIAASISAALTGAFNMFGYRQHDKPLRSLLILGEDTIMTLRSNLSELPYSNVQMSSLSKSGQIKFAPLLDTAKEANESEIFGEDGILTKYGRDLFSEIRREKWDFIVFDTISSLSSCEYLARQPSYATTNALNKLASDTGAAVIYNAHLTKDGGKTSVGSGAHADELINIAAGSNGLIGAARNAIVIARRPEGMFDSLDADKDNPNDEILIGVCKSNINRKWNKKIFPVIRDSEQCVLRAVDHDGKPLLEIDGADDRNVARYLDEMLPLLIEASAAHLQPLARDGKLSPPALSENALGPVFERGTKGQIENAIVRLLRRGSIVIARPSRTGPPVLDVPGGPFASPELHLDDDDKEPKFRKGAPDAQEMIGRIEVLRRQNAGDEEVRPVPTAPRQVEKENGVKGEEAPAIDQPAQKVESQEVEDQATPEELDKVMSDFEIE